MAGLTIDNPVTLTNALSSGRIIPGDVLELLDGVYTGLYEAAAAIAGTEAAPVIIRPRNPGGVTIDGSLLIMGVHVHVYDLNFTDSRIDRTIIGVGVQCSAVGFQIHGCVISDMHNNGISWMGSGVGEVSENIILNCGYKAINGDGHAHSIYTHNNTGGARLIARNMMADNYGEYTIHLYSPSSALRDYTIENNVIHGDAVHAGGAANIYNLIYRNNIQYKDWLQFYTALGATIQNNEWIDSLYSLYEIENWTDVVESGNIFYPTIPAGAVGREGYSEQALPATKVWLNAFTKSARWLGNVAIYNRDSAATVAVDFSSILSNGSYKLRNSLNPDETWEFEFTGAAVNVPTNFTSRNKVGEEWGAGAAWPVFGSCVIETT
jgi:hypothetical protein